MVDWTSLLIVGAGGFAREVALMAEKIGYPSVAFVEKDKVSGMVGKFPIYCSQAQLEAYNEIEPQAVIIAVGTPHIIHNVAEKLRTNNNLYFPTVIHPYTDIGETVIYKDGNIICAGNIFTTDITIGSFNIFNLASTFGHDTIIGDCNVINPGCNISGGVTIGNRCLIGTGAVILEGRKVGDDAIVGGGAVVTKDVAPGTTVVGIPARPINAR